jgi:hypothetical protein
MAPWLAQKESQTFSFAHWMSALPSAHFICSDTQISTIKHRILKWSLLGCYLPFKFLPKFIFSAILPWMKCYYKWFQIILEAAISMDALFTFICLALHRDMWMCTFIVSIYVVTFLRFWGTFFEYKSYGSGNISRILIHTYLLSISDKNLQDPLHGRVEWSERLVET